MGGQQARVIWGGPACQASACAQVQVPCPQPPSRILGHRLRSKALKPQKPGGGGLTTPLGQGPGPVGLNYTNLLLETEPLRGQQSRGPPGGRARTAGVAGRRHPLRAQQRGDMWRRTYAPLPWPSSLAGPSPGHHPALPSQKDPLAGREDKAHYAHQVPGETEAQVGTLKVADDEQRCRSCCPDLHRSLALLSSRQAPKVTAQCTQEDSGAQGRHWGPLLAFLLPQDSASHQPPRPNPLCLQIISA